MKIESQTFTFHGVCFTVVFKEKLLICCLIFVIATEDLATPHNVIITPGSARFPLKENIEAYGIETWISTMLPDLISRYL